MPAATSVRQLSEEHGMRMIQSQFPRLKDPMLFEEFGEQKVTYLISWQCCCTTIKPIPLESTIF